MKTEKKIEIKKSVSEEIKESAPGKAIVFDLDNVAFNVRQLLRKAITEALKEAGANIDQSVFLRHCINGAPAYCVPPMLEAMKNTKTDPAKIVGVIEDSLAAKLKKSIEFNKDAAALISSAKKNGFACGGLTFLRDEPLQTVINKAGEGVFDQLQTCGSLARIGAYSVTWRTLAANLGVAPQRCVAVVGNDIMCKSALAAGMRCIVVPDEFTACQDFAGADAVLEKADKLTVQQLNSVLQPYSTRASK